eukprot:1712492-Rhodomonas_salina.4
MEATQSQRHLAACVRRRTLRLSEFHSVLGPSQISNATLNSNPAALSQNSSRSVIQHAVSCRLSAQQPEPPTRKN